VDRKERLAILSRDDEAAAPFVGLIAMEDVKESWQLIEPTGVRMMHGPAGVRLLEYLPGTRWLGRILRTLRLTFLVTATNRMLGRIRKPLGRFFPNPRVPHRWP
jgi:hypothetical protein